MHNQSAIGLCRPVRSAAAALPFSAKLWLIALLLTGFVGTRAHAGIEPQEQIRQAAEQVLGALEREGGTLTRDPGRLYELVDAVLLEHMDFERMSRWVLGRHWKIATPEQQTRFVAEFRRLLVRTYATALASYGGQQVHYLPQREVSGATEAIVRTVIRQPAGPPIAVNYSLYSREGEWKAYDVQIDGISLIANYRATFAAEVRVGGLEALIHSLAARNRDALNKF
jgi:phospholipid transport system substrate-binding protein